MVSSCYSPFELRQTFKKALKREAESRVQSWVMSLETFWESEVSQTARVVWIYKCVYEGVLVLVDVMTLVLLTGRSGGVDRSLYFIYIIYLWHRYTSKKQKDSTFTSVQKGYLLNFFVIVHSCPRPHFLLCPSASEGLVKWRGICAYVSQLRRHGICACQSEMEAWPFNV